jgi:hypothetical protein
MRARASASAKSRGMADSLFFETLRSTDLNLEVVAMKVLNPSYMETVEAGWQLSDILAKADRLFPNQTIGSENIRY